MITAQEAIERLERAESMLSTCNHFGQIAKLIRHQQGQIKERNNQLKKHVVFMRSFCLEHNCYSCSECTKRFQQQLAANTKLRSDLLADDLNQDPPGMEQKI